MAMALLMELVDGAGMARQRRGDAGEGRSSSGRGREAAARGEGSGGCGWEGKETDLICIL